MTVCNTFEQVRVVRVPSSSSSSRPTVRSILIITNFNKSDLHLALTSCVLVLVVMHHHHHHHHRHNLFTLSSSSTSRSSSSHMIQVSSPLSTIIVAVCDPCPSPPLPTVIVVLINQVPSLFPIIVVLCDPCPPSLDSHRGRRGRRM